MGGRGREKSIGDLDLCSMNSEQRRAGEREAEGFFISFSVLASSPLLWTRPLGCTGPVSGVLCQPNTGGWVNNDWDWAALLVWAPIFTVWPYYFIHVCIYILTGIFLAKLLGVHLYTHVHMLCPPLAYIPTGNIM